MRRRLRPAGKRNFRREKKPKQVRRGGGGEKKKKKSVKHRGDGFRELSLGSPCTEQLAFGNSDALNKVKHIHFRGVAAQVL